MEEAVSRSQEPALLCDMANPCWLALGLPLMEYGPLLTRILRQTGVIRKDPVESRKKSVSITGRGWVGVGGLVPVDTQPPRSPRYWSEEQRIHDICLGS